jgi:hypothetical protein
MVIESVTITPAMLRAAADELSGSERSSSPSGGSEFICNTAAMWNHQSELRALLLEGGIESLSGTLFTYKIDLNYYEVYKRDAMNVRFMFLEFLALMLEAA